jgi:type I restriction enzyme S subunit
MKMATKWKTLKVADLGRVVTGKTPPTGRTELLGDVYPFITPTDIGDYRDCTPVRNLSEEGRASLRNLLLPAKTVCVTCIASVGKMCMTSSPSFTNQQINSIIVDEEKHDPSFVYYLLKTRVEHLKAIAGGAATPIINKSSFSEVEVRVPELPTQRKIADILSAYDDLIENNLRRIKILEEMAQSLYREWFVYLRFPGHESVSFIDSPLGQIPKGWEVKAISDFGKVVTGKTPSKANEDFFGEDIPFLKTPDMHGQMFILRTNEYLSTAGAQSQANKTLPVGSICVSCIGTIGVVSITTEPCQTNQQINSVVLADEASREFLFFWLREAKQMLENLGSNGATMGNVNKSKFESMKLDCPSVDLLTRFHSLAEPMFQKIESLFRKIQNLRHTRDILLPHLLKN